MITDYVTLFNRLIEEFMLLANMAVAQKISKHYPAISLLRRHPSPKARAMDSLVMTSVAIGILSFIHCFILEGTV